MLSVLGTKVMPHSIPPGHVTALASKEWFEQALASKEWFEQALASKEWFEQRYYCQIRD
jgi:hypothetical protein